MNGTVEVSQAFDSREIALDENIFSKFMVLCSIVDEGPGGVVRIVNKRLLSMCVVRLRQGVARGQ